MTLDEIKRLIEFVRSQDLTEFELEQDGVKLRIKSGAAAQAAMAVVPMVAQPLTASLPASVPATPATAGAGSSVGIDQPPASETPDTAEETDVDLAIVKSPIVGTFYRAAEPGAKPFVEVGDEVKKGGVLCIIEAMKLMNEIDSEYDGQIVNVYVENGQAVQYGERLFAIRLRG
jgi:acetyl-CoA carboxylase biotin carboxyl carrier protein